MKRGAAFSLAEVMLAVGLFSIVVLSVIALGISALTANRKALDTSAGQLVASAELQKTIYEALNVGPGDPLWTRDNPTVPMTTRTNQIGNTEFRVAIYATDVLSVSGPLRGASSNRAKKVDVLVTWWDVGSQGRQGYGLLKSRSSRIVNGP